MSLVQCSLLCHYISYYVSDRENFKTWLRADIVCEQIINLTVLKDVLMPILTDKFEAELIDFNVGILSNFDLGEKKYQDILRNYLGKHSQTITG